MQVDSFKHYQREFMKFLQKINKDIKRTNAALSKDKKLRELRQFVK